MFLKWAILYFCDQLSNDQSSLVWSTDKETAKGLLNLSSEVFTDRINQALVSV